MRTQTFTVLLTVTDKAPPAPGTLTEVIEQSLRRSGYTEPTASVFVGCLLDTDRLRPDVGSMRLAVALHSRLSGQ